MEYKDSLTIAMTKLGKMDNTIFLGQQILFPGNPMSSTLVDVPKEKMIELPVMEDCNYILSKMGLFDLCR